MYVCMPCNVVMGSGVGRLIHSKTQKMRGNQGSLLLSNTTHIVCMYVCMYVWLHTNTTTTYIHTYIHTCTHMYTYTYSQSFINLLSLHPRQTLSLCASTPHSPIKSPSSSFKMPICKPSRKAMHIPTPYSERSVLWTPWDPLYTYPESFSSWMIILSFILVHLR